MMYIDANLIHDWASFHAVFSQAFGFPDFYGNNMNAWIDCLSSLTNPEDGMTTIHIKTGETLTLMINNADSFKARCPEQFSALVECTGFVNYREAMENRPALIALAFNV